MVPWSTLTDSNPPGGVRMPGPLTPLVQPRPSIPSGPSLRMISSRRNVLTPIATPTASLGTHSTGILRTLLYVSPYRPTLPSHLFVFDLSSSCGSIRVVSMNQNDTCGFFRSSRRPDYLNPLASCCLPFTHLFNESNLDSPVNRAQAHNPFGKRHSIPSENSGDIGAYLGSSPPSPMFTRMISPLELPALPPSVSPSVSLVSLSPATVPLPSPSPDETTELDSVN